MNTQTPTLRHRSDCTDPKPNTFIGKLGDPMLACHTCGAYLILHNDIKTGESHDAPAPVPTLSRYRCPAHDEPVTWKGRGCTGCQEERRAGQDRHLNRHRKGDTTC